MAKKREGFILYKSFYEPIRSLAKAQKGCLLDYIFMYHIDGSEPLQKDDKDVYMAFLFFKNQFRIDNTKYEEKCEINSESAKQRWHNNNANASEPIQTVTNDADKDKDKDKEKDIFEIFRKLYAGRRRGLDTEFNNFKKKHKDWKTVLPTLLPAVHAQIKSRSQQKGFVPEWKDLSTWINNRCWEDEIPKTEVPVSTGLISKAGDYDKLFTT